MPSVDLEAFELVLLRRPVSAPDYPEAELERIQREHLEYHAKLREAGQVTQLRYGTVAVNVLAVGIPQATWGGYPGHPDTDIQSGRGVIGNTLMLPDPEKTVISAPFRTRPTPAWFATQPGMLPAFRALPAFEAAPTIPKLAGLMRSALRHR